MSKIEVPMINISDFSSIRLKINLTNTTTQTEIRDGKRGQNKGSKTAKAEENLEITISEFLPDGLVLEIPEKTCSVNHNLLVEISSENLNPPIHFTATMKVNTHEKVSRNSDRIEASFLQKDEQEWSKIQRIYNNRQEEIRNFFNSVKGFEST